MSRRRQHADRSVHKGEVYVKQYQLERLINQCLHCQVRGHKPEVQPSGHYSWAIMKYFKPLYLNEQGLCEVCQGKND